MAGRMSKKVMENLGRFKRLAPSSPPPPPPSKLVRYG
jgi:hypothetical protein